MKNLEFYCADPLSITGSLIMRLIQLELADDYINNYIIECKFYYNYGCNYVGYYSAVARKVIT